MQMGIGISTHQESKRMVSEKEKKAVLDLKNGGESTDFKKGDLICQIRLMAYYFHQYYACRITQKQ